ncbi:hypothetical protein SporoP37_11045 [Sporosarcina sp. P37]|uniref:LysR family transcriptional regulator n=1 Tax=unclassified Sporosarcina TaxID=2647733 RepID=UPI0009BEE0C3|nr:MULTISPECIES: LysR family transcriptional regulator [unclassified Sporosarcina]ARD48630.1 hypothetical protein SporoP33_10635 [Sporosarcina sp. P33]ARK25136.1 hypothetical protein SporoP37_11045 [Sporosarcina sp. P37]PID17091.1 LysR family transcriptional regulator [Sporosarcina sp. P35]
MNIQRLKYFMAVVEHGTISKAAIALNITQPPLSAAIKGFEDEIGVNLFDRIGKRMYLNDTGRLLYRRGKELLASAEIIIQEIHEHHQGEGGHITIGSSTIANLTIIPEVVHYFNERDIPIIIHVKEGNAAYILEQIRHHKMDIGILRNVFNKEDLHTIPLLSERLLVALPPSHPLADNKSITLDELKDEKFFMQHTTFGHGISEDILEECHIRGFNPNIIYWGTETLPMLNMVKKGMGVAFCPEAFSKLDGMDLPPLLELSDPVLYSKLNLVTSKNGVKKAAAEHFIKVAKEIVKILDIH